MLWFGSKKEVQSANNVCGFWKETLLSSLSNASFSLFELHMQSSIWSIRLKRRHTPLQLTSSFLKQRTVKTCFFFGWTLLLIRCLSPCIVTFQRHIIAQIKSLEHALHIWTNVRQKRRTLLLLGLPALYQLQHRQRPRLLNASRCQESFRRRPHSTVVSDCRMDWARESRWGCTACSEPFLVATALSERRSRLRWQFRHTLRHFLFSSPWTYKIHTAVSLRSYLNF